MMNEAEKRAANLLARHGVATAPTPVEQIARAEGIQVVRSPASGTESAFLLRDGRRVIIGVNSRTSSTRQRFSIAHELGHWDLHEGEPLIVDHTIRINKRNEVSSAATDWQEIEANAYAAELLMPRNLVQRAVERELDFGIVTREGLTLTLAREFDVSTEAMGFRLINLGIFSS